MSNLKFEYMLLEKIQSDLTTAMKARDQERVDTLRFLIAAVKKFDIDTYLPGSTQSLTEADVVKIVQKQVKTHRESIEAFQKAGRTDLVQKEQAQLAILETYMPKELTDTEIAAIVAKVKAAGAANFGQAMGMAMKEVAGRADGGRVAALVKEVFG